MMRNVNVVLTSEFHLHQGISREAVISEDRQHSWRRGARRMWVEAAVFIETPEANAAQRDSFDAAMRRRGWESSGTDAFKTGFTDVQSDEQTVNLIEQDIRQSAYVSGISKFEAACILSDGPLASSMVEHIDIRDSLLDEESD